VRGYHGDGEMLPSAKTLSRYAGATGGKFHMRLCGYRRLDTVIARQWYRPESRVARHGRWRWALFVRRGATGKCD